ncbi:MAG: sigma 54-interacting transcriptional regulator [Myxococcales bacterium]|jgi:transcriptional regulatory protein RtcR|nr:sigma 54-interacting transcriptional regulator [Myxococcales bacterium]
MVTVIGLLGSVLDAGGGPKRWEKWRPTVSLTQHDDLEVGRLVLLYDPTHAHILETVRADIAQVSPATRVDAVPFPLRDPWDFEEVYAALSDFSRDFAFHPEKDEYLVHITTGSHVVQICLFLLTESRHFPGRLLQTSPPKGKKGGPGAHRVIDLDLSRYDAIAQRRALEHTEARAFLKSGIETKNAAFNRMIEQIEEVAVRSRAPLLLLGPTGAGKSHLARRIYELKRARRLASGDLADVNCATIRGDAAMSALFGHVRGAFTGAASDRAGLLMKADGGVLFLDEIGELGLDEQAMLLRALEDKTFFPLGSDREKRSDFQLICGTNRDLGDDVRRGRFREDLLARIQLWTFRLPPLRERPEDIGPNLDWELERAEPLVGSRVTMSREARAAFMAFATSPRATWRSNFRDLNAAAVRMATLAPAGRITALVVEAEIARLVAAWSDGAGGVAADAVERALGPAAAAALDRFDRVQLADVLEVCRASQSLSEAGRALFAASRAKKTSANDADRLRKYLARFGLRFESLPR